jgi:SP family xylose:H+ symportor-like MFS transporter
MHTPLITTTQSISVPAERTRYVWGIAIVAALGGLLFGYDWVVIGGARAFYEVYFHLTSPALIGWVNSCALVGCLLGSLAAGLFGGRYGRRRILLAAAILFAVSSALTGWSYSLDSFVLWRILGGVAIGLCSSISPLYIAEISPAQMRGRLVSLNQFAIVIGILMAQILNWLIARPVPLHVSQEAFLHSWNVLYGWRWMFTALVVPAAIFMLASIFIPESPRWLFAKGKEAQAFDVLRRIGGEAYARAENRSIEDALLVDRERSSWRELLHVPFRRVLLLGAALAVLQQWTGINILFNYAAEVYRGAGYGTNDIFLNIVITGTINLIFTIMAILLVDRVGRRGLMIYGCLGIAASHVLCAVAYHARWPATVVLTLTLSAIACYALTLAPVTWVLIAEIFPNRVRSQGVSAAVTALWIASFALTYSFPILNRILGTAGVFLGYGIVCLLGCAMVLAWVPETKGRSLEEIESSVLSHRH